MTSDKMSVSWWDSGSVSAEATSNAFVHDAVRMTIRKEIKYAHIEQKKWQFDKQTDAIYAPGPVACDILNNVALSEIVFRVTIKDGVVTSYATKQLVAANAEAETLKFVPSPTAQYAKWYKWLLSNPAMHKLCIAAPTIWIWKDAIRKTHADIPHRIAVWLYKIVHHALSDNGSVTMSSCENVTPLNSDSSET
jgi:hypothetical protein